ncbi:MAG: D-alanyl-D-alanine carboxypeptidase/D-alanyl-D-alanine-endopeptidase [Limnohabitans sp.]|nr:D-alanyl-D-alanine carboxypeptidase/D-alanyl-D-alanine-endopeptidase [Limnohabitans sp.]
MPPCHLFFPTLRSFVPAIPTQFWGYRGAARRTPSPSHGLTRAWVKAGALALGAILAWPIHAQNTPASSTLPRHVLQTLQQAQVPPSALSVQITPLPISTPLSSSPRQLTHLAQASVNPASVMKLFTTYAALNLLGPDHVWRNRIYTEGTLRDGVLHGHLIVRGSGDPKLVVERLQALLAQVQAAGVREVRGDIVLDRSVFDVRQRSEPFDDEPLRPYNVSPDGLLLNFKAVVYKFTPDMAKGQVQVRFEPPLAGFMAPTQVPLSTAPCNDWRRQLQADFSQPQQVRFAGQYPASCGEREWPVAYPEPEAYAPRVMQALWLAAGGQITGQVRYGTRSASARLLLEAPSLPLSDIIRDINKFSNNVMAQQVFLTLSSELGSPGRFEASRVRLSQWWRSGFAQHTEPVLDNGSGLSRNERSTAQTLTALLQAAHAGPHAQHFSDSLSLAGVDGTAARLKERSPQSPVIGKAWLKTGSLRDVASVAGYVQGQSGQRYTLVAILNHPNAHQARAALDQLLEWTVRDQETSTTNTSSRLSPTQALRERKPAQRP